MKNLSFSVITTNIFGTVGYLLLLFGWALSISFIILIMVNSEVLRMPSSQESASMLFMRHLQTPEFVVGIGYLVAIVGIIVTVCAFIALPYLIGMWSTRGLRRAFHALKLPVTMRTLFLAKCSISVIPLVGFLLYQLIMQPEAMLFSALYITALIVTIFSLMCFTIQLFLGRYLRVSLQKIW